MEIWVSLGLFLLLLLQTRRLARYQEVSEKTIYLLEHCVDESTAANKELNDLLLSKLPHLKDRVDRGMAEWRKQREEDQS